MDKSTVIKAIDFFEKRLLDNGIKLSKIILFGSYANGNAANDSDVDIIVVSSDFDGKDIFERALLTKDAEILTVKNFLIPMDIIMMSPREYENETICGEVIYDNPKIAA